MAKLSLTITIKQPSGGFVLGQVPFAATSPWNTPIRAGASYSKVAWPATDGYAYGVNWDQYSPGVWVGAATDPVCTVTYPDNWGRTAGSVSLRCPTAVTAAVGTDGEAIVIWNNICYNFYQFSRTSDTVASCADIGWCNVLTDTGFGTASPFLGAGTTAIGASEFGGLIVQAETDAGAINHAIQLGLAFGLASPGFVAPAIAGDGGASPGLMVEGQRLAIPPNVAMPTGMSRLGQIVYATFVKYGAIVVDTAGFNGAGTRMQANAYSKADQSALWPDLNKLIPLLEKVS